MLPDYSRSQITAWFQSSNPLINNKACNPKDKVHEIEMVRLTLNQNKLQIYSLRLTEFNKNCTCLGFKYSD